VYKKLDKKQIKDFIRIVDNLWKTLKFSGKNPLFFCGKEKDNSSNGFYQ